MKNNFQGREGYDSPEYRAWRYHIFARDKWECQQCHNKNKELEAHHIIKWAEAPHLRYVVSNGITLCKLCHAATLGREEDFQEQFQRIVKMKAIEKSVGKKSAVPYKKPRMILRNPRLRM